MAATPAAFSAHDAALRTRDRLLADVAVFVSVALLLWGLLELTRGISASFDPVSAPDRVSTDPRMLPGYAGRSLLRMFTALALSTLFAFVVATAAARLPRARRFLLPALDVLQSVPVLGFLSVTVGLWLALFPGSMLGLESAAVFAIFTSQVWNMTFAFYQSLITQPRDLDEACRSLGLTRWQRFWRLDAPHGAFPLVWNGMMSFGGGWFFLLASEVITVNSHRYALPGIGAYAATAAEEAEPGHLVLAICVMVLMILVVNVCFWRPLTAWAERFRTGVSGSADPQRSVVLELLRRSSFPRLLALTFAPVHEGLDRAARAFESARRSRAASAPHPRVRLARTRRGGRTAAAVVLGIGLTLGALALLAGVARDTGLAEFAVAGGLGLLTFARVLVLLVVGTLVWVPIGLWIGLTPRVTRVAQPLVQVLASFPANFLFPFAALAFVSTGISLDVGGIVLMALGAQWYLLFNAIAGAAAIPNDLREAAQSLRLGPAARWRRLYAPALFPSWVTGALTAAGGAWNASIVAEVVSYGGHTLTAHGLGAYIAEATATGDFTRVLIGILVMSVFVVTLNRLVWRPLYVLAERRYALT